MTDTPKFNEAEIEAGRLLFARPFTFIKGAVRIGDLPEADRLEIAFAGRSNVGKSSLINALTGTTGVYSRAGTVELPGDGAHCVQYENCMLFVLRSNSFTECPAGATVELQASTGQRISGTNQTPLPRNGTLPFEIEWPLGNATAELSTVTCE